MKDIVKGSPFLKEELLLTLAGEVDYPKFLTNLFAKPFAHDYKYWNRENLTKEKVLQKMKNFLISRL